MTTQDDPALASLVVQAVERLQQDGPAAIDSICREHPTHANALRSAIAPLAAIGLTRSVDDPNRGVLGPGRKFANGEFELLREIGRGGMGVVFEATQSSLGRSVALKLLAQPLELDPTAVQRFEREARTAASLTHPGIAEVHAFSVDAGIHYLAMEFVDGTPLDAVIQQTRDASSFESRGKALPGKTDNYLRSVLELVEKVALALAYAHDHGIVHRDIKPSNILLRPDGTPVITDFGLAQQIDLPSLTRTGAFVGTPHYTAPEQHSRRADAEVDGRADVFSLGVTLYELLTDRRPFGGETTQDVLRNVATLEPADPQTTNPRLPSDVAAIVLKALEKEPAARYGSAAEFAADLRAFLEFRPVRAKRAGAATKVRRWVRREPLRAAFFGLIVIAVPAVAALAGYIAANRPLVAAAERQAELDAAEASLLTSYVGGMRNGRRMISDGTITLALAHPATRAEALVLIWIERIGSDTDACFRALDAHPFEGEEPRAIARLRAMCKRAAGDTLAADQIETRLGEPTTALEHLLVGKWILNQPSHRHKFVRSKRAIQHFRLAAMLSQSPRPTILHSLAAVAGNEKDTATGRAAVAALMEQWEDHAFAWEAKGLALEHVDADAAIEAFRHALEIANGGESVRVLGNLGQLYSDVHRVEEARECLDRAIALDTRNSFAHAAYAKMHLFREGGSLADAIEHASKAIEFGSQPADTLRGYRLKIRALAEAGRADEAVALTEQGLERFPGDSALRGDRVNSALATGDWQLVLAICDEMLEGAPDDGAVLAARADALTGLGRQAEAVADLHARALADPKNQMKWHDVAIGSMQASATGDRVDADLAIHACRKSNALSAESNPYLLLTYSSICMDFEDLDEASRLLDAADKLLEQPRWKRAAQELRGGIETRRTRLIDLRKSH